MRNAIFFMLPMLLSACATTGTPTAPVSAGGKCSSDALGAFEGQKVTAELGAQMLAKSGAHTLRWGGPGMAMTMDYREDRLTISYDEAMLVTSAQCG